MLLTVVVCIRLGLWQQHKAEAKHLLQTQLDQRMCAPAVALPPLQSMGDLENWRYRRVKVGGHYDARYQILLDNQVEKEVAGYHVITPLRLEASDAVVLVNRGWIAAPADRKVLPPAAPPAGRQEVEGYVWLPPAKVFALQAPPATGGDWQPVWQNMEMKRYAAAVPFAVYPMVLRQAPDSAAGGLARNWPRPAERIEMHVGYAYQWFGFALAIMLIYVVVNIRKIER